MCVRRGMGGGRWREKELSCAYGYNANVVSGLTVGSQ